MWRVDVGPVRWVGVDLPEVAQLRREVLPHHPRRTQVDASVLGDAWPQDERLTGRSSAGGRPAPAGSGESVLLTPRRGRDA